MKKLKKNKSIAYIISFLIPMIIMTIGFLIHLKNSKSGDLYPGYGDFHGQYTALFTYLKNVLHGDASAMYSFSKGIGGSMISTYAYYLISPLNLLVGLVKTADIPMMLLGIIILKVGLAGLFMYIFLRNVFKSQDYRLIIFSTCYALSAYSINFFFCIMWLDALYMLPLILLGLRKILDGKSPVMYILCLCYAIICNYYIGYMICIFICIYFIYEIINRKIYKEKKQLLSIFIKFLISSILSGFMSMILLLPTIINLSNTARSLGNYKGVYTLDTVENNFNFISLLYRTLIGSHNEKMVSDYTVINIYCGMIILPLIYFYFVNKNVEKREKYLTFGILILFLMSYSIKYVNYVWHGFAFPNGLNYRFTFLFIFFFITIACHSFLKLKSIQKEHYLGFFAIFLIIMNLLILNGYSQEYITIYSSTICLGLYLLILYIINNKRITNFQKKEMSVIIILLVFSELLFNIYFSLNGYFIYSVKEYNDYIEIYGDKINKYKNKENEFYRMHQDDYYVINSGLLFNYNGMQSFLSTMNINELNFFAINGYLTSGISLNYSTNSHLLIDSLIGLKYYLGHQDCGSYNKVDKFEYSVFNGLMYNLIKDDYYVCENEMALSLGFMIDKDWNLYGSDMEDFSYLEVSESIANSMIENRYEYYKKYNSKKINDFEYIVSLDDSDRFYITQLYLNIAKNLRVYVNDERVYNFNYGESVISIENKYKGEDVKIRFEMDNKNEFESLNVKFYGENIENIKKLTSELKMNQFEIEMFKDTNIKGNVTATKNINVLFLSIPYEDGWSVYVDGEKVKPILLYDAFIGVELEEGEHTIELKYNIPGLKLGASISTFSFIITIIYLLFDRKKRKESQIMLENKSNE